MNNIFYTRRSVNRPIYATWAELYDWAYEKTNSTEIGDPYHDSLIKLQNALKAIASLFDGTLGAFTNPMTGEQTPYPEICDWTDILGMYLDEYGERLIAKPLCRNGFEKPDDAKWYHVLEVFCGRVERLVKFLTESYSRILRATVMEYNPLADYFSKDREIGGTAPYAEIVANESGEMGIDSWTNSNGKDDYKSTSSAGVAGTDKPTTKNFTTTYDDSSTGRLAGYSETSGKTQNVNEIPNSAYFKNRDVEGNDASSPQEALEKELQLANALMDLVHQFCEYVNKEAFLQVYRG